VTTNEQTLNPPDKSGENAAPDAARAEGQDQGLAQNVQQLTVERDQWRDQMLRTAADFDNYRKRSRRDVDEAKQRGKDDTVRELLPVFDNLQRAIDAAQNAQSIASVVEGVQAVLTLFLDTAERMGITPVKSKGERFDPTVHEAIQQQETNDHPPGTILAEVVPGYKVGDRLLRAAMVVVARKPAETKSEN